MPSHSFLLYTTGFIQILETPKIIKPKVSNGKKTAHKSTTFAHPNLQSTSLVSKNVIYNIGTLEVIDSTMNNSQNLQPTIYDPPFSPVVHHQPPQNITRYHRLSAGFTDIVELQQPPQAITIHPRTFSTAKDYQKLP